MLFAVVFALPAIAWWRLNLNPIVAFWAAYVVTRPLGASFADGFSKPTNGGLGLGDGMVSAVALVVFIATGRLRDRHQARRATPARGSGGAASHVPHPHRSADLPQAEPA